MARSPQQRWGFRRSDGHGWDGTSTADRWNQLGEAREEGQRRRKLPRQPHLVEQRVAGVHRGGGDEAVQQLSAHEGAERRSRIP
jgi:hypothetical protein